MISKLLLFFIFIIPLFGKNIDYSESIIFYSIPSIIFLFLLLKKQKFYLSLKNIIFQLILIILFLISVVFSKNIGYSYYQFFIFLNTLLIISLAVNTIESKDFSLGLIIFSFIYSIVFLLNRFGILNIIKDPLNDNFILQNWGHSYIAEILILSIPFLLDKIISSKKNIYIPISIIIFISLFLSNSRTSLIVLILSSLFLKFKGKTNHRIKIIFILLCSLGLIFNFYKIFQTDQQQKTYGSNRIEYWQQSIKGFIESPFLGNGPGNFPYINQRFQTDATIITSYAHSSFLTFLSENGIFFTIIFFSLVVNSLIKTSKINNLFFVCGLASLIYSFIDFNWSSPGIFVISLYLIFYYPFLKNKKEPNKITSVYLSVTTVLILLFTVSKITSDFFFLKGDYKKSISFDYFNLNPRLETIKTSNINDHFWQNNLKNTLIIYNNETAVYDNLINILQLPESEEYYYKLVELNPGNKTDFYLKLANFYETNDNKKNNEILAELNNLSFNSLSFKQKTSLSKFYYHHALDIFSAKPEESVKYFEKTVQLVPILGYFHVDLANAYWHTNQKEKALNQLKNICQQYLEPKQQCQEYLQGHIKNDFEFPGQNGFIDYIDNKF